MYTLPFRAFFIGVSMDILKGKNLISKLELNGRLEKEEYIYLLDNQCDEMEKYLYEKSASIARENFGNEIYFRGLIEVSNFCACDCFYCGIRKSNSNCHRYRLSEDEILSSCKVGYSLGFRTFVLQGGEDPYFNDEILLSIVSKIRKNYPDCAITLSLGERSFESYKKLFDAGANRYLLRHETATKSHYSKLHPNSLTLKNRLNCLKNLKEIGYQTGCGIMVGSPFQSNENLANDLVFIQDFQPEMVGIGPFISHKDTPFRDCPSGTLMQSLFVLALVRLILPKGLLPSTTALGSIHSEGREKGILVGANVVMPNLSPCNVRKDYMLYDNKVSMGSEAYEGLALMKEKLNKIGYVLSEKRGDFYV